MFKKLKEKKEKRKDKKKEAKEAKTAKTKECKEENEEDEEEEKEKGTETKKKEEVVTKGKKSKEEEEEEDNDDERATPEKKHTSKKDKKSAVKEKKEKKEKKKDVDEDAEATTAAAPSTPLKTPPKVSASKHADSDNEDGDEDKKAKKKKKKTADGNESDNDKDSNDTEAATPEKEKGHSHHHKKGATDKKKKRKKSKTADGDESDGVVKLNFEEEQEAPKEEDPFNEKIDIKSVHTAPPSTYTFTADCLPVFEKILNGNIEEGKSAIRELTDLNVMCPETGITPLHLACVAGKIPLVELLLDLGAKPYTRDSLDNTPLHLCAYFRRYHTARKFLLKIKDKEIAQKLVNKINHAGMSPLYIASATGDVRIVELFFKYGADINSCALENRTPLHEAALSGNSKAVDFLLKNGADMTVIDITQRTPLHYSVLTRVESRDVVTSLTQSNTCFFMTDRWGFIPLQYAILQRFDSVISLFTMNKNGCNVCTVYDLRKQMIMETAPKIPELPTPLGLPDIEQNRPRSVMYLIKPGRPLPEGVSPDEVNPVETCLPTPRLTSSSGSCSSTSERTKVNRYGFITVK